MAATVRRMAAGSPRANAVKISKCYMDSIYNYFRTNWMSCQTHGSFIWCESCTADQPNMTTSPTSLTWSTCFQAFPRSISTIRTCETEHSLCASHVVQDLLRPSHHVAPRSQNSVWKSNVAAEWLELQPLQPVAASTSLLGHIAHSCHWGIQQSRGAPLCGHLPNGRPYLGFAGCISGFHKDIMRQTFQVSAKTAIKQHPVNWA